MRIIDIVNGPWAITPAMLTEVQRIYASHLHRSEKIDIAAIEAATGKKLNNSQTGAYVVEGVAVIPMQGVIGKRMNLMTQISGGVSTEMVANDYITALNDPAIKGVVLHIDSPGGTVDGTKVLADLIAENRGVKPVIALADGMMCSAAYWIGSAADSINMADLTTDVGSIGVVAAHMDISGWEEKQGVKTTEITAGQYKRAISQYAPLSDEGRAMIQADLDQIYGLFVDAVAQNRGVGVDEVIANMAEGRVFLGQKALDNGLVDSVATLSETIRQVSDLAAGKAVAGIRRASAARNENQKGSSMELTLEQLKTDHPETYQAAFAEGQQAAMEGAGGPMCGTCACQSCTCPDGSCATCETRPGECDATAARAEGAAAELARIQAVRAQAIPGHEALVDALAFDGKSTAADAALAIVNAEKELRGVAIAQLDAEAPPSVPAADAPEGKGKTMKRKDFDALDQTARRAFLSAGGKLTD